MSSSRKRQYQVVDLTSDGEDEHRIKQPRTGGSQPRASQSLTSTDPVSTRDQWSIGQNEEEEIIDLSQDIDEGHGWTILGSLDGKIVGIRYYNGFATPGEQVLIKREPGNPYDSNAIRVNNVQGTQIGHLPKNLAAKLAPYLVIMH
jgi:SWI/SNF-related matrix-associated actin-dependent regulator of chromatin subfamily A3